MSFEIIYQEPTLSQVLRQIKKLNSQGYDCYFKGKSDGSVKIIIEDKNLTIVNYANKLIEEVKQ